MNPYRFLFKWTLPFLVLLLTAPFAGAQHMEVEHGKLSVQTNIFLHMMDSMMLQMGSFPANESVEMTFVGQMILHHGAALEMARYEIAHGQEFATIQLAKSILAEQAGELRQMEEWVKGKLPQSPPAPLGFRQAMEQTMRAMMQNMPADSLLTGTDSAFSRVMIPHHQAAVDMAKAALSFSQDSYIRAFAKQIISSQQVEIEQMLFLVN